MPFKDPEKRKRYGREYHKTLNPEQKAAKLRRSKEWWQTPKGRFSSQKYQAIRRGIGWELTFEDWLQLWQESGHWNERGPTGYVMCRKGDTGPYSTGNVYIATASVNKKDAWLNNRITLPGTTTTHKELQCES